jgi:broad specificity phosphatase PhoE
MTEITLVRHGQASLGSDDYDKLSNLGKQQAVWLGEHFAERQVNFDRVIIGTQLRHRQTAEGILSALSQAPKLEEHAGFNEYDFETLFKRYSAQYPDQLNTGYSDHRHLHAILRKALACWSEDQLTGPIPESWANFCKRVQIAIDFSSQQAKEKVLIVSSGGPIAMIMKHTLNLNADAMINLNLQVLNTSVSHFLKTRNGLHLMRFNNIPHLDQPSRKHNITYS